MFNKTSILAAVAVLVLGFQPVIASSHNNGGGRPDHANGGNNKDEDDGNDESPDEGFVICVDAGHGGDDSGAMIGDEKESDLNLEVAKKVEELWNEQGDEYNVVMTREADESLSNRDRYTTCNDSEASSLVSIHHNSFDDDSVDYTLGLYHQKNSLELTETVGGAVAEAVKEDYSDDFRTDKYPSGVLIKSDMPSMISEGYFMSHHDRYDTLTSDSRQELVEKEAEAIVAGLGEYYGL